MTVDQRFSLLLVAIALLFSIMSALVALLWRAGNKTGELLQRISDMQIDIANLTKNLDAHIAWHLMRTK